MAIALAIVIVLMRSRLGYYLLAVREDEDAARAAGISVTGVKLRATALSAALTAIGGGLFAMYVRTIDPLTLFSLPDIGVKFALLTLIGGMGTIAGPVLGAFLIIPLESYFRAALGGAGPGVHLILLGGVMIARRAVHASRCRGRDRRRLAALAACEKEMSDTFFRVHGVVKRFGGPRRGQQRVVRSAPRRDRQHHRARTVPARPRSSICSPDS